MNDWPRTVVYSGGFVREAALISFFVGLASGLLVAVVLLFPVLR